MKADHHQPEQPLVVPDLSVVELVRQPLMTQTEVAELFRVSTNTVSRWAKKGLLRHFRTLGGHKRFHANEVLTLAGLAPSSTEPDP